MAAREDEYCYLRMTAGPADGHELSAGSGVEAIALAGVPIARSR